MIGARGRVLLFDWDEPRPELPALGAGALRKAGAQQVVLLGDAHGVDLLDDPQQAKVRAAVDRYLARVLT